MKIISYNINGIRSGIKKGFLEWLNTINADVVCLQEVKALESDIDTNALKSMGYNVYWNSAQKKGYSGVSIFSKIKPKNVVIGCGNPEYDNEGRFLRIDFHDFSILNVYIPSGSSGNVRQSFKNKWLVDFYKFVHQLKNERKNLLICGDFNICHKPIDIHNPKANANSSGFLPEERQWFSDFLGKDFIDTFRLINYEPHNYTWWSYRSNARNKNLGWRIDYHIVTKELKDKIKRSVILPEARHSDHCPILVEIENSKK